MSFDLVRATREFRCRGKFRGHAPHSFYPSEASVVIQDENGQKKVLGGCIRAAYFRCTSQDRRKRDDRSQTIAELGKAAEDMLVEDWKRMGIFVDRAVRFENRDFNIRGEIDVVLREPDTGTLFGVECKSIYGYRADAEVFGNSRRIGRPKVNHLLQTLVYTSEFMSRLAYFKMYYIDRGDGQEGQFDISVQTTEEDGKTVKVGLIDGEEIKLFTVDDIYGRFTELKQYLDKNITPAPDYELYYSDGKIEFLHQTGEISKSKYEKFRKKGESERPGDWQCRYCNYKDICWV
ncbi:MAG: hypothetical protein DRN26_00305 [Thermoplasmata archaeon]|nr:MAG: hypothetical protein DRN26_00305 [Thermoplasmata archaeon]